MQPNILHLYLMIKVLTFFVETSFQNFLTDLGDVCSTHAYHKIPWLPKNNIKLNSLMLKLILIIVHKNRLLTLIITGCIISLSHPAMSASRAQENNNNNNNNKLYYYY